MFSSLQQCPNFHQTLEMTLSISRKLNVVADIANLGKDAPPSVNELISSLRKTTTTGSATPTVTTPTLPPHLRQLLAQPETPTPRARGRRRRDENGRLLPAGPAPPISWLDGTLHAPVGHSRRQQERVYPTDVEQLPGLPEGLGKRERLQDMCLRQMARHWEFVREYESNNLADLPTGLRVALLSAIAVDGPDEGVGFEGLRNIIIHPDVVHSAEERDYVIQPGSGYSAGGDDRLEGLTNISAPVEVEQSMEDVENADGPEPFDPGEHNESFYRLDLSGSLGHSISFKQLTTLLEKPKSTDDAPTEFSWEETLTRSLNPPLPHLTHLSLSHPSHSISWPRLLSFANHTPTLTHLSLAYWPVPSLTLNAKTAMMSSRYGKDIQYGGTNYYSHSLDNDFREAAEVIRRLAGKLYLLEWLDLSGCLDWIRALRWTEGSEGTGMGDFGGVGWGTQWLKMRTIRARSGTTLDENSGYAGVVRFVQGVKEAWATEDMLAWFGKHAGGKGKRGRWIDVEGDDWKQYEGLWEGDHCVASKECPIDKESKRKRAMLESLGKKGARDSVQWRGPMIFDDGEQLDTLGRRSMWDQ
jgi:hypothetical protein